MEFAEIVKKNRSYRRFDEGRKMSDAELTELVELTRFTASGGNKQALRYRVVSDSVECAKVFATLGWAAYLKDWNGPIDGERPTGYIIILQTTDCKMLTPFDGGIAMQTILLGAVEKGLGGCIFGNIKRQELSKLLALDEKYEILAVIALGKPIEAVVIDDIKDDDVKYWRDENKVHHVPKRTLMEILLK